MTTVGSINKAYRIASDIEKQIEDTGELVSVHIDDWSNEGSFRMFITFDSAKNGGDCYHLGEVRLRLIGSIIRKAINENHGMEVEYIVMPHKLYYQINYRKYFNGYNEKHIQVEFRIWE